MGGLGGFDGFGGFSLDGGDGLAEPGSGGSGGSGLGGLSRSLSLRSPAPAFASIGELTGGGDGDMADLDLGPPAATATALKTAAVTGAAAAALGRGVAAAVGTASGGSGDGCGVPDGGGVAGGAVSGAVSDGCSVLTEMSAWTRGGDRGLPLIGTIGRSPPQPGSAPGESTASGTGDILSGGGQLAVHPMYGGGASLDGSLPGGGGSGTSLRSPTGAALLFPSLKADTVAWVSSPLGGGRSVGSGGSGDDGGSASGGGGGGRGGSGAEELFDPSRSMLTDDEEWGGMRDRAELGGAGPGSDRHVEPPRRTVGFADDGAEDFAVGVEPESARSGLTPAPPFLETGPAPPLAKAKSAKDKWKSTSVSFFGLHYDASETPRSPFCFLMLVGCAPDHWVTARMYATLRIAGASVHEPVHEPAAHHEPQHGAGVRGGRRGRVLARRRGHQRHRQGWRQGRRQGHQQRGRGQQHSAGRFVDAGP